MRRLAAPTLVAGALILTLFAGCLGGDVVEPPRGAIPSAPAEDLARAAAAADQAGGEGLVLVAAFALEARAGAPLSAGSLGPPALASVITAMAARAEAATPDGRVTLWGFLYRAADGEELTLMSVDTQEEGGADPVVTGAGPVSQADAEHLGASAPVVGADLDSAEAVAAARNVGEWARTASEAGSFVLMTLTAPETGNPVWRLLAAHGPEPNGFVVMVDAVTGELLGVPQVWPTGNPQAKQTYSSGLYDIMLPGDTRTFTITVPEGRWTELVVRHEMTGNPIGSPAMGEWPQGTLTAPSGEAVGVPFEEPVGVPDPEPGEWEVVIEYPWVTSIRSVTVHHCLRAPPQLLAPEGSCRLEEET